MNIYGKKLKNFTLVFRYVIRAVKNIAFLIFANKISCETLNGAAVVVYKKYCFKYWLVGDPGLKDRIAYNMLRQHGFKTRVIFDPSDEDLKNIPEKTIWFNPHHFVFGEKRQSDGVHAKNLSDLIMKMEYGERKVFPSSRDILFWENKLYMHQRMAEQEIRHPKSIICSTLKPEDFQSIVDKIGMPFLLKSPDGYSSNGIILIKSKEDFEKNVPVKNIIVQEFLNITMDLRLIMVDGVTESFYWRKNPPANVWKPTATSGGATVQFHELPDSAEQLGREIYKLYGVQTFGADICWRNDDLSNKPYVLEFSPIYQPNPIPSERLVSQQYSHFKERTIIKYDLAFEKLISELFSKQLLRHRAHMKVM